MIILKHLTVERFKLLRELNLHFPQRGSILIQGPNESGKSALLESIYFALYGETLQSRGKRSLDDLISYGADSAAVTLCLAVGATSVTVTRSLERGQGQIASLSIQRSGELTEETYTSLREVNENIIRELGWMDGETLRNTCLIAQKELERLEHVSGSARDDAARRLLGLEDLLRLSEQFTITEDDEQHLQYVTERLRLAEIQTRIPQLSKQLEDSEISLDAVVVREKLEEIAQQDNDIAEQERVLENVNVKRAEVKSKQARAVQLKQADETLAELIAAYDEMAEARRERPELEKQIADLERRERDELPVLEKRVGELAELTRSFGTLQRMSNDLLSAVDAVKDLEKELKKFDAAQQDLTGLDEQVAHARALVEEAKQALKDIEDRRKSGRPQLEARLTSLDNLAERLGVLRQTEEQYSRRLTGKGKVAENKVRLDQLRRELRDAEEEMQQIEAETRQVQDQAGALEQRWRQIELRQRLLEWLRLKKLSQGLNQAEQQLAMARQHQIQLAQENDSTHGKVQKLQAATAICGVLTVFCLIIALMLFFQQDMRNQGFVLSALAIGLFFGAILSGYNYKHARDKQKAVDQQMQSALNHVGMMAAARETALHTSGNNEELYKVEQEIRSLGSNVPRSLEEAQRLLAHMPESGENQTALQQQLKKQRDAAQIAQKQVNVARETTTNLRKEYTQLDGLRQQEDWDNIEERLREDLAAVERMQQEIAMLAGQEGLPMASINARLQHTALDTFSSGQMLGNEEEQGDTTELETLVDSMIVSAEQELAAMDGKLDLAADLASQVKIHQEALDILLVRKQALEERNAQYEATSPTKQIERAREQQAGLRQALQDLRDSLRQRVKQLGVDFGQAAITTAEIQARKQLETMHITLGNKMLLQEKLDNYSERLKVRQESLSELYKQLSKFSNTLGNWIVPLNPFADALLALRSRCERELQEINEEGLLKEKEGLQNQQGALKAKIELCRQEIETAREQIAALLAQHNRPAARSYVLQDLAAVWPLLNNYSAQDYQRLNEEQERLENELDELEKREHELSKQLDLTDKQDLEVARTEMEQQERIYQTKKHGLRMIEAVHERLMGKVLPRTEQYMHQILPSLTGGRYHDVHLVTEAGADTACQLQVWESAASKYVHKSELSGGASDLLSLALRLSFAIATLPRETSTVPGFVILDEPLSSFDRSRAKALVNVATGDILSQHFEQILLISHNSAFDPALFPYHIYMDNGLVAESNLPAVPEMAPVVLKKPETTIAETPREALAASLDESDFMDEELDDGDEDESMNAATIHVSALPARLNSQ